MASKSKKQAMTKKKTNKTKPQLHRNGLPLARRCVSQRASSSYQKCPMQLVIYLSLSDHWFLHSHLSNLLHKNHPKLNLEARLFSQKDLSDEDKKLLCLLYNVNVPPMTISKVLSTLKDHDVGSYI